MLLDVGIAVSNYDDFALIVRRRLRVGVADPRELWLPAMVVSARGSFTLDSVVVRAVGDVSGHERGRWNGPLISQRVPRDLPKTLAGTLVDHCAFGCVRADLGGLDFTPPDGPWLLVEARVRASDGTRRTLAATSAIRVLPLPSPQGWHPGDTHVHTTWSDGRLGLEDTVRHAHTASGLSWVILTDHAAAVSDGWNRYVAECGAAEAAVGMPVCPGAEFAARGLWRDGHALGHSMSTGDGSALPPATNMPQELLTSIGEQGFPDSFATIAHPYHWHYDWPNWSVTSFRGLELATGGWSTVAGRTRRRWFRLLREDLERWSGAERPVDFVVGLASTDSHCIPLSVMPGERHITWVHTGTGSDALDRDSIYSSLRSGRCVVSCGGDFGTLSVNGHEPGTVCNADGTAPLRCEFRSQPRGGHVLESVRLMSGRGRVVARLDSIDDGSLTCLAEPPAEHDFLVAKFAFGDGSGKRWEVWTNPVWIRRA